MSTKGVIEAKSFTAITPEEVDTQLEDFCMEYEIKREEIIKIYFYVVPGYVLEDGSNINPVHVGKLVFFNRGSHPELR